MGLGSSGGGGGGGSGAVDYPEYMKEHHHSFLEDLYSIVYPRAISSNPYAYDTAANPSQPLADMYSAAATLAILVQGVSGYQDWPILVGTAVTEINAHVLSTAEFTAEADAYNAILDADTLNITLPRFYRGMQDINAVNSSSFVVGAALINAEVSRNKAKFAADLMLEYQKERIQLVITGIEAMTKLITIKLDSSRIVAQLQVEVARLRIIADKEYVDQKLKLEEMYARWPMEAYNYLGNMLASIGGASVRTGAENNPLLSTMGTVFMGIGGIMEAAQPKCCFIFLEAMGGVLDPVVRAYRDSHMTIRNRRGYCKLADILVPRMQKSKLWRKAVEWFMTKPMAKAGRWYYGREKGFPGISIAVGILWLIIFDLLGVGGPYQRKGGEWV